MSFRWLLPPRKHPLHEEWEERLTPKLRETFGALGEDAIQHRVERSAFTDGDDLSAARAWLAEKQRDRELREFFVLWVVVLSLVASIVGIVVSL